MFNFLKKKQEESPKKTEQEQEGSQPKSELDTTPSSDVQLPSLDELSSNEKQEVQSQQDEGIKGEEKSDEENTSFEIPDFTEEDLKLKLGDDMSSNIEDFANIKEKKSDDDSKIIEDPISNQENEGFAPDEKKPGEQIDEIGDVDKDTEIDLDTDEEITNIESDEEQDKKDLFEGDEQIEESHSEEDIPFFDMKKDFQTPKFVSKHKYKDMIFNIIESKETIQDLIDIRKELPKTEHKSNKELQSIGKDMELIKEILVDIDKKIFI